MFFLKKKDDSDEDDIDESKVQERSEEEIANNFSKLNVEQEDDKKPEIMYYKRLARHFLADQPRKEDKEAHLTAAAYHKQTKILVAGFSTGAFFIYEMPEVNLIHSLTISQEKISAISINLSGDWIALACGGLGQLLVWEWQSNFVYIKR